MAGTRPGPLCPLTNWSIDWRLRPVRAAISEAHTSSSGSTRTTSKPSTDSTASMAERTASRSAGFADAKVNVQSGRSEHVHEGVDAE